MAAASLTFSACSQQSSFSSATNLADLAGPGDTLSSSSSSGGAGGSGGTSSSSSSSGGGGSTYTIHQIQPALAVRGMSCLSCHANIQSSVITDFGYGSNWFLDQDLNNWQDPSSVYVTTYYDPWVWQILQKISGQVIVPQATVPAALVANSISGNSTAMDLAAFLTSPNADNLSSWWLTYWGVSPNPSTMAFTANVTGSVSEQSTVYIGAPTASEIQALAPGQPAGSPWINKIVNGAAAGSVTGLGATTGVNGTTYFTNTGVVQCNDMDVVINGTLLLNNLTVQANSGGCRFYVAGSVFIEGPITYAGASAGTNADATSNLQITSAKSIIIGVGLSGVSMSGGSVAGAGDEGTDGNGNPLSTRLYNSDYVSGGDARNPRLRVAPTVSDYNTWADGVMAEANNIGGTLLVDAYNTTGASATAKSAAGQTRTAINYSHLLLNAPDVQSRYLGNTNGVIISEIAIFSLGEFSYSFDPVFTNSAVPILPILPYDILCVGNSSACNPASQ